MWDLKKYSKKVAAVDDVGGVYTYGEINKEGMKLNEVIGGRCLVFSFCSNTIGSLFGYITFINNRIVPALLSQNIENDFAMDLLQKYQPKYIWIPDEMVKKFAQYKKVYSKWDYTLLKTDFEKQYDLYDELGLLLTTSGSTGSPKFVRQSYNNINVNAHQIVEYLEITDKERAITTLPMNYTYGLSIINSHFMVGATILLTERTMVQKQFWTFLAQQQATSFGGVPYTYEMLNKLKFFKKELPSLQTMTQAGGKLSPELHKKFAEYAQRENKKFIVMYGQCEATARMAYLPSEYSIEKFGSMGIPIPGGKFCLIDVSGKEIEQADVAGELIYEGANVTLGYAENGEGLSKEDERKGYLATGDVAKRDKDGFYYVVGRLKRFLKIYGNRVNLDEIERMIKGSFEYIDCATGGIDDHMFIFITRTGQEKQLIDFIIGKTGLNHAAFQIRVIDEIPKNEAGKTLYRELEKYYEV